MVELDLGCVNKDAPYSVEFAGPRKGYRFITDAGVEYGISFEEDIMLSGPDVYQFLIVNLNNRKSPRDAKLRRTIMSLIYAFFDKKSRALLYICETGDSRQRIRNRLFSYWYETSPHRAAFTMMNATITDQDGNLNYASIIMRTDNPNLTQLVSEFGETVRLLNDKPDSL